MNERKYVIFDLDGTLVDSYNAVVNTCKKVFASCSPEHVPSDEFFMSYRSQDMEHMFNELAEMVKISSEDFRKKYDEQYAKDCISGSSIITEQYEILKEAKGIGIGIIVLTNKKQEIAEEVCEKLFGDNMIDIVIGRKDTHPIKPRHVIINRLNEFGISQDQCLRFYGDSNLDFETAKLLKVRFINIKTE